MEPLADVSVAKPDGTMEVWDVEAARRARCCRGWTKDALPGTKVVVEGFMAKDGSTRANARDITLPDGKKMFIGSSGTGAPDERPAP